jgi:hypothetical protein
MNLKGLINKGDREIDEEAELFIARERLSGSRKSAVKSMLLEMGYSKESIKENLDKVWRVAATFRDTDVGREFIKELNREKLMNGVKFLFMSLLSFVIEYCLYYFFEFNTPTIFFIFILPGIYYVFRGVTGL